MARVGVVGYGKFGAALADLAGRSGHDVLAFDPVAEVPAGVRASSIVDLASRSEIVVVAVSVLEIASVLASIAPHVAPSALVLDVASVKIGPEASLRAAIGRRAAWVATHPLFGPVSLALAEKPRVAIVCPNDEHPGAAARAGAFYASLGCDVHEESAASHDARMAKTHALAFFVAKGLLDAGAPTHDPFVPPSYGGLLRTIESVRSDAGHLFRVVETENPFAKGARAALLQALRDVDAALEAPAATATEPTVAATAIPDLGARSPELRAVREHIDALDAEILDLLGRRGELAMRAARAKGVLGAAIKDEAREAALFAERRRAAAARGLDPDDAARVFEAILAMSRNAQSRG